MQYCCSEVSELVSFRSERYRKWKQRSRKAKKLGIYKKDGTMFAILIPFLNATCIRSTCISRQCSPIPAGSIAPLRK